MKYSFRKMAMGAGIAGLIGAGAIAADSQGYQQGQQSGAQSGAYDSQQGEQGQQSQQSSMQQGEQKRSARAESSKRGELERQGTIRSLDKNSRTLTLSEPKMQHRGQITWSGNTEVLRNGKAVGSAALREGERVTVIFRKQGDRLVADQIIITERQQARRPAKHHQGQ